MGESETETDGEHGKNKKTASLAPVTACELCVLVDVKFCYTVQLSS